MSQNAEQDSVKCNDSLQDLVRILQESEADAKAGRYVSYEEIVEEQKVQERSPRLLSASM